MVPAAATLASSGLPPACASAKETLFARAAGALPPRPARSRRTAFFVPGRIEVLGKHTDYAGGRSLLCAASHGFCLVGQLRADSRVRVISAATGSEAEWVIGPDLQPVLGDWSNYPATVVRRLARNFPEMTAGADLAFDSDLPPASGMSSSSAFMIAVFLALADLNGLGQSPAYREAISSREALAAYLATIENGRSFGALAGDRGVGTFGGSEDHTAILCCKAGTLSQYRFGPVTFERDLAVAPGLAFLVAFSGVLAEKTAAAMATYNRASLAAARILAIWQQASGCSAPTLESAAAASAGAPDDIRRAIVEAGDDEFGTGCLLERFDQFLLESRAIVPEAGDALIRGDLARFGALVDRSQEAAERWLGNQIPETVTLAREARRLGAAAASAFGGGFGGSVWALVPRDRAGSFAREWHAAYRERFPGPASCARFFETSAGPSAMRIEDWSQGSAD